MLIPLWAKALVLAGIVAAGYFGWQYIRADIRQEGYEARTIEYTLAVANAQIAADKARIVRDTTAETITDTTRTEAQAAVTEQQQTTAAASERVRTIIKTVQVPGSCPTTLPLEVEDEGRAAVARANGARR